MKKVASADVSRAMRDLTNLQRQVINLRFAGELSIAETAQVMNRSKDAVKFLQINALRGLRRTLVSREESSRDR